MQIYLARNNQQAGPYTLDQVNQMLANQQILLTDLAWHQGMAEWKPLGELTQGQLHYSPNVITQSPTISQSTENIDYSWKNPHKKEVVLAKRSKRILAKIIDLGLLAIPQFVVTGLYFPFDQLNSAFSTGVMTPEQQVKILEAFSNSLPHWLNISLLIYTLFLLFIQQELIRQSGQSIGKKIFKLQIVDIVTNEKTSTWRAFFVRSFLFFMLSQFLFAFPLLIIIFLADFFLLFSKNNQTLHDRLAKTKIINLPK